VYALVLFQIPLVKRQSRLSWRRSACSRTRDAVATSIPLLTMYSSCSYSRFRRKTKTMFASTAMRLAHNGYASLSSLPVYAPRCTLPTSILRHAGEI
jgi:hypothetical protein